MITDKDLVAKLLALGFTKVEMFDWHSHDGNIELSFNVSHLWHAIETQAVEFSAIETYIDPDFVETDLMSREPDEKLLLTMTKIRLEVPVIFVDWIDDSCILVDGTHRYIVRHRLSLTTIKAFRIPYLAWRPFVTIKKGSLP